MEEEPTVPRRHHNSIIRPDDISEEERTGGTPTKAALRDLTSGIGADLGDKESA